MTIEPSNGQLRNGPPVSFPAPSLPPKESPPSSSRLAGSRPIPSLRYRRQNPGICATAVLLKEFNPDRRRNGQSLTPPLDALQQAQLPFKFPAQRGRSAENTLECLRTWDQTCLFTISLQHFAADLAIRFRTSS